MADTTIQGWLDDTKDQSAPAQQAPGTGDISKWASGVDDTARLALSVKEGAKLDPDVATRVVDLQKRTGLPAEMIERDPKDVQQRVTAAEFDADKFRRSAPGAASWISDHPNNAAVAAKDLTKLPYIERLLGDISSRWNDAQLSLDLADLGKKAFYGTITPQDRGRQRLIEGQMAFQPDYGIKGIAGVAGASIGYLPALGAGLWTGAKLGAAGAVLGGAGGAVKGAIEGAATGPAAEVMSPALAIAEGVIGAGAGAEAGFHVGNALKMGELSAYQSYLQYEKIKKDDGTPLDRNTLVGAALLNGIVNGAMMAIPMGTIAEKVPGLKLLAGNGIAEMLKSPSTRDAFAAISRTIAEQAGIQGGVGFSTSMVESGIGNMLKLVKDGSAKNMTPAQLLSAVFPSQDLAKGWEAAKTGAQAGVGMGAASGSFGLYSDLAKAHAAITNAEALKAAGDGVANLEMMKTLPAATQDLVKRMVEHGSAEKLTHLYLPVEPFNEYFQKKGVNPRDVAGALVGDTKAYDESMRTGADLPVPTEKYATQLAPQHGNFFAQEMRTSPNEMNGREAGEYLKKAVEAEAQKGQTPEEVSAGKVQENVAAQLTAAGFTEPIARDQAQKMAAFFKQQGARAGVDPHELFSKYGLRIERPELGGQEPSARAEGEGSQTSVPPSAPESALETPKEEAGRPSRSGEGRTDQAWDNTLAGNPIFVKAEATAREAGIATDNPADVVNTYRALHTRMHEIVDEVKAGNISPERREALSAELDAVGAKQTAVTRLANIAADSKAWIPFYEAKEAGKETTVPKDVLHQFGPGDVNRARISFGQDRQFRIDLMKDADLSSFLHESGHLYLEVLGDLAQAGGRPELEKDYAAILKELGVENRDGIKDEHHEKFAKLMEAYLMEGKAPSAALRLPFARFRSWLVAVYGQVKNLGVELKPEVRDVFDRMFASSEEITSAEQRQGVRPLFDDPRAIGMTDRQTADYLHDIEEARAAAEDQLNKRVMGQLRREQESWWKDQLDNMKTEVAKEVNKDKLYVALEALQRGRLPTGEEIENPIKLSKEAIIEQYGSDRLKNLPKPYVYSAEGGVHPDQAADFFGYHSGDEMLSAFEGAEPRKALIARLADERMRELHGDIMTDGTLPDEAMKAIHSEKRAELLRKELEYLASNNLPGLKDIIRKVTRKVPPLAEVRAQAEQAIRERAVRDIQPSIYQRAEMTASNEAVDYMLKGDMNSAFESKQRELLNSELYRAATNAQDDIASIQKYMQKFDKPSIREKLAKAGDYLDMIDSIRERFDFRKSVSNKALAARKSLVEWVAKKVDEGFDPNISKEVLNEANLIHYKDLSYEEMSGVRDSVKTIEHLASVTNRLLADERKRTLQAAVDEITASIKANHDTTPEPKDYAPGLDKKAAEQLSAIRASHKRMEFLFEHLDGKPQGPVWEHLFKPFADGDNEEAARKRGVVENLDNIFGGAYTRQERALWFWNRTHIPEIGSSMTKATMLAAALNWGNQYNRDGLMRGGNGTAPFSESQVQAIFKHLDRRDWETVQKVWSYLDTFRPDVGEQEKALNGSAPKWVEASPFDMKLADGSSIHLEGGYYPIVFDGKMSWRQSVLDEKANVKDMFGGNWASAMTRHGHTEERTNTGGKPIRLELTGLTNHLSNVIHDLSFRKAVIDANRLVSHPDVRAAIEGAAGREMYRQLRPWIVSVAGDRSGEYMNPIEGILGTARGGATIVNLGWNLTTALVHTLGVTLGAKEIGSDYMYQGMRQAYAKPWEMPKVYDSVAQKSELMREIGTNFDRDVRDATKRIGIEGESVLSPLKMAAEPVTRSYYAFLGAALKATATPIWLGAYNRVMDGGLEGVEKSEQAAVDYADRTVRMTIGSGKAKDLAAIQRGNEAFRLFTMFYSPMAVRFNQFDQIGSEFNATKNTPKLLTAVALAWFLPAVMEQAMRGNAPSMDDDKATWAKWLLKSTAMYPFESVILMRDIVNGMRNKGFEASPAFDAFDGIVKASVASAQRLTGEKDEFSRDDIKNMAITAGYFGHFPSRQMWKTSEYVHDWMTGDEQPANPLEGAYRAAVTGKPKR